MANPYLAPAVASARIPNCGRCGDTGARMPIAVEREHPGDLPAKVFFERGIPCDCPEGAVFAAMRAEWNLGLGPAEARNA